MGSTLCGSLWRKVCGWGGSYEEEVVLWWDEELLEDKESLYCQFMVREATNYELMYIHPKMNAVFRP